MNAEDIAREIHAAVEHLSGTPKRQRMELLAYAVGDESAEIIRSAANRRFSDAERERLEAIASWSRGVTEEALDMSTASGWDLEDALADSIDEALRKDRIKSLRPPTKSDVRETLASIGLSRRQAARAVDAL